MNRARTIPGAVVALAFLAAVGLGGCRTAAPATDPAVPPGVIELGEPAVVVAPPPPPPADAEPEPYRVGPGDVLELDILGVAGTRRRCLVLPDGTISYDLLASRVVEGRTLVEIRDDFEAALAEYYRGPQVGIVLREARSRRVWVLGRVNTPGLYPLDQPLTLLEALARAGGTATSRFSGTTEELADLSHSFVVRDGEMLPVDFRKLLHEGDRRHDIPLRDGDYVYLPSALAQEIHVLGAVRQPKAVGFRDRVTLVSAIAAAKDVLPQARTDRVVIIRGALAAPEVYPVDFGAIRRGLAPDVALRPRDIVYVPDRPWFDLEEYARAVVRTFVGTVAANEGARYAVPGGTILNTNPLER